MFLWCLHCYCCVSIVNDFADTVEVNITLTSCSRSQLVRRHHVTIVNDYSDKQFKILLKLKQILLLPLSIYFESRIIFQRGKNTKKLLGHPHGFWVPRVFWANKMWTRDTVPLSLRRKMHLYIVEFLIPL